MKIFRVMVLGLIICFTLTCCSNSNTNDNGPNSRNIINSVSSSRVSSDIEKDSNELFEISLYSDKQNYITTDRIKIWAELKYIGDDSQVKIWHSNPYMSFTITDGKKFNTGGMFDDILTSSTLVKDKIYKFDYVKSGGYSADDPDAEYWNKFYQEKDLYLPKGEYTVRASGVFSLSGGFSIEDKEKSNLLKEIKIKIED